MAQSQQDLQRLVVSLEAKLTSYDNAMKRAQGITNKTASGIEKRFKTMERELSGIGKNFFEGMNLGTILGGITAAGIVDFAKEAVKSLAEIKPAAEKAGVSIAELQKLTFAGIGTGTGQNDIVSMMEMFNKKIGEAATKGGDLADLLAKNGVSLRDANGAIRNNVDLLGEVANLVKNAGSSQEAALVATLAMGKAGAEFLPFLKQGSAEMHSLMEEATKAGYVIDTKLIQSADEFDKAWNTAWAVWTARGKGAIVEQGKELENFIRMMSGERMTKGSIFSLKSDEIEFETPQQRLKRLRDVDQQNAGNPRLANAHRIEIAQIEQEIAALNRRNELEHGPRDDRMPSKTQVPIQKTDEEKKADAERAAADKKAAADKLALAKATDLLFAATRRESAAMIAASQERGKTVYEIERQKKFAEMLAKLEDEHRQHGGFVSQSDIANLHAAADAYGRIAQAIADNARQLDEIKGYTDVVFGGMEDAIDKFIDTGKLDFKDLVGSIIKDMAKLAVHNLFNTLENGQPGTGNAGLMGIFQQLLGGVGKSARAPAFTAGNPAQSAPMGAALGSFVNDGIRMVPLPGPTEQASYNVRMGGSGRAMGAAMGAFVPSGGPTSGAGPFLDLLGKLEGTDKGRGYNETLGYGKFSGGNRELTSMSLDQIRDLQNQILHNPANTFGSSAVGRYQMTRTKLDELRGQMGLTGQEKFDPAMQDRLALMGAQQRGPSITGLGNEWEGIKNGIASGATSQTEVLAKYNAQFANSMKEISTTASTTATDFSSSFAPALQSVLGAVSGGIGGGGQSGVGGIGNIMQSFLGLLGGGRASGGPVRPGKIYRVNENGEEFFSPSQSGFIIPNGRLRYQPPPALQTGGRGGAPHQRVSVVVEPSPLFSVAVDTRASRIASRGDAGTLDRARREGPGRMAKFNQLGT